MISDSAQKRREWIRLAQEAKCAVSQLKAKVKLLEQFDQDLVVCIDRNLLEEPSGNEPIASQNSITAICLHTVRA